MKFSKILVPDSTKLKIITYGEIIFFIFIIIMTTKINDAWKFTIEFSSILGVLLSLIAIRITLTIRIMFDEIKSKTIEINKTANLSERLHDIIEKMKYIDAKSFDSNKTNAMTHINRIVPILESQTSIMEKDAVKDIIQLINKTSIDNISYKDFNSILTSLYGIIEICKTENQSQMIGI